MGGRVFISCGQRPGERQIAEKLSSWFKSKGYSPYVAIEAQSIQDVNSGIITELKNSDFYVFVDFRREKIGKQYRGSLFTNQELAIVYYLGFEKVIFFQESEVLLEGLLKYMLSNVTKFDNEGELLKKVKETVKSKNWEPAYTRHLIAENLKWSKEIPRHIDHVRNIYDNCKLLQVYIKNNREDISSFNTVARLDDIECNGNKNPSPDKTLLKATDQPGFNQVIWPKNYCAFDLLLIQRENPRNLYLLSALDSNPRSPIIEEEGNYNLYYSIVAEGFPLLNFVVNIIHKGDYNNIEVSLK
jgi:hypothetical protein